MLTLSVMMMVLSVEEQMESLAILDGGMENCGLVENHSSKAMVYNSKALPGKSRVSKRSYSRMRFPGEREC